MEKSDFYKMNLLTTSAHITTRTHANNITMNLFLISKVKMWDLTQKS